MKKYLIRILTEYYVTVRGFESARFVGFEHVSNSIYHIPDLKFYGMNKGWFIVMRCSYIYGNVRMYDLNSYYLGNRNGIYGELHEWWSSLSMHRKLEIMLREDGQI